MTLMFPILANTVLGYNGSFYIISGITFFNALITFFIFKEIQGLNKQQILDLFDLRIKNNNTQVASWELE